MDDGCTIFQRCGPLGSGIVEAAGAWRVNRGQVRRARRRRLAIRFLINPFFCPQLGFGWTTYVGGSRRGGEVRSGRIVCSGHGG